MERREEERPAGGAVLCCRVHGGGLEARRSIARGGKELGDGGGGIIRPGRPEVEKTLELGEGLCGTGGGGGDEEVTQEGLDFVGEGWGGFEVGGVVEEIADQVEKMESLAPWAGPARRGERGREGGQVFSEQHDAGATRGNVFENPALAVL